METKRLPYRIDRLPVILPFHRRADNRLDPGDLVYYGPSPEFYGIGEIIKIVDHICIVDFRGTGTYGIHKDAFDSRYLIPIHKLNLSHLLKNLESQEQF
ncbi:hypothetical protein QLX67_08350 [Balneolaceae bacterium ANBcel3]|nr:hypothetical protein [Balneolaceae bacterium ANBcel3]